MRVLRERIVAALCVVGLAGGCFSGGDRAENYATGQAAEGRGEVGRAIESYQRAVSAGQSADRAAQRLGVLYFEQKRYAESASAWEAYVGWRPKSAEGWGRLGQARERLGDFAAAEGAYRRGIEADPEDHSCAVNLGMMLVRRGRGGEGMKVLEGVMRPAEAHYSLGVAYEQAGEGEKAKEEYRKAREIDPAMEKGK